MPIESGRLTGTVTNATTFCPDLITTFQPPEEATGTLTYGWKANRATPISPRQSTQVVDGRTGDVFSPGGPFGPAEYVLLSFLPVTVSGAFAGGDAGASSSNVFATSQDWTFIQSLCAGGGVKLFNLGSGTVTLA